MYSSSPRTWHIIIYPHTITRLIRTLQTLSHFSFACMPPHDSKLPLGVLFFLTLLLSDSYTYYTSFLQNPHNSAAMIPLLRFVSNSE